MLNNNSFKEMQLKKEGKMLGVGTYIFHDLHIMNISFHMTTLVVYYFNKVYKHTVSDCRLELLLMCPFRNLKLLNMNFSRWDKCFNPWPDFFAEILPNLVLIVSKKHLS